MSIIHKGYAAAPDGQIHYRQHHQVGGTPLVLLHQTASSGMMFEQLMACLSDVYDTVAPDTPGFGASFSPFQPLTISYLAEALYVALTALGITSCFLFGHHTGAAIAVQMAFDHPAFVQKMILSGPPLLNVAQVEALRAGLKPFALTSDGAHLTAVWQRIRERDSSLPLPVVQRETLLTQWAQSAAQETYEAVFRQPLAAQLATLTLPVLVMCGENDTLRTSLEPAFALLQKGQKTIIPGAGPYICDQKPEVVAEIIKTFFCAEQAGVLS
ncbi:MAG: alpha/beta hydrolase [Chloroflexi bacterium]|nr:alpha/beta hydrolase [Ardenticatenaceae bacterium]NOG33996.1 alpha/beta hydrolase [Chloroflexota bacterium]GIK55682.1 MAG: hypothetical protein BroJett015_13450 [Chloroflexota bacterium]